MKTVIILFARNILLGEIAYKIYQNKIPNNVTRT